MSLNHKWLGYLEKAVRGEYFVIERYIFMEEKKAYFGEKTVK